MPQMIMAADALDTRRSLLRVWMAITAVWLLFWFAIALVALATLEPGAEAFHPPMLLLLGPPGFVLAAGVIGALVSEGVAPMARRSGRGGRSARRPPGEAIERGEAACGGSGSV